MKSLFWPIFWLFVFVAIFANWDTQLLNINSSAGLVRTVLFAIWVSFVAYSYYCSRKENIFRTIGVINKFHWARQIEIDLYISVFLSIALVYLVTESVLATAFWSLAFIPFANMGILLFIILHVDEIISAFIL